MKLVPGSHKLGFQKWHRVKGDAFHDRINADALDTSGMIYAELAPGDVLIFNQLLVHGSDEAHTDSLRLVYRVSYQGFEEVCVPRGSPIVMRGGRPASIEKRFPQPYSPPQKKSLLRRAVRKVGRKLAQR